MGLKGGWKVFLTSMTVLLTVLGAVLPWLLALGVPRGGAAGGAAPAAAYGPAGDDADRTGRAAAAYRAAASARSAVWTMTRTPTPMARSSDVERAPGAGRRSAPERPTPSRIIAPGTHSR